MFIVLPSWTDLVMVSRSSMIHSKCSLQSKKHFLLILKYFYLGICLPGQQHTLCRGGAPDGTLSTRSPKPSCW